jgi:hypothetical protein
MVVPDVIRDTARRVLDPVVRLWLKALPPRTPYPADLTAAERALCVSVAPFTMTGPDRVIALANSVKYVVHNAIPGAIVECGVWRGGSMMAAARTLLEIGAADRDLYLFDTFEGMTPASDIDRDALGRSGSKILAASPRVPDFRARVADFSRYALGSADETFNMWCIASEDDVRQNMSSTGYPSDRVHLVKGRVEDTIPTHAPERIALLRLDTDWYASTKHELDHLYARLSPGGVLIIDDYGTWEGARRAVDEFFATQCPRPLLHRIDQSGRCCVKPASNGTSSI